MNNISAKFNKLTLVVCFLTALSSGIFAQATPRTEPTTAPPAQPARPVTPPAVRVYRLTDVRITSEKSLVVDPKVSVSLCVLRGNLKINGWDRNEIRVFVQNGSRIDFKVSQKSQSGNPVWVRVLRGSAGANQPPETECLNGDDIEIDLPRNAGVTVKGQETRTEVDSIRKANVNLIGGNIFLTNVDEGIEAVNHEGDITAESCNGTVNLESTNGNITVFETAPSEIGDTFKAKTTNGAIVLQNVGHRQIEVNSNSGTIFYNGDLPNGGLYNFSTLYGSIIMSLPKDSSCKITASYGLGEFNSELPLKDMKQSTGSKIQNLTALLGTGDATLNLTTYNGKIRIRDKK